MRNPSARLHTKTVGQHRAIMVNKILKGMDPEDLKGKFTRRTEIEKFETRKIIDLQIHEAFFLKREKGEKV